MARGCCPKPRRWSHLLAATGPQRAAQFKETSDHTIGRSYPAMPGVPSKPGPLREETDTTPRVERVAYRSFDRQYLIRHRRVIDRPCSDLWRSHSDRQTYISEQHDQPVSEGTSLAFSALVPDTHHFKGRERRRGRPHALPDPRGDRRARARALISERARDGLGRGPSPWPSGRLASQAHGPAGRARPGHYDELDAAGC
jgi:hypothetical protein